MTNKPKVYQEPSDTPSIKDKHLKSDDGPQASETIGKVVKAWCYPCNAPHRYIECPLRTPKGDRP